MSLNLPISEILGEIYPLIHHNFHKHGSCKLFARFVCAVFELQGLNHNDPSLSHLLSFYYKSIHFVVLKINARSSA